MAASYPQIVEVCNPTIGGLRFRSHFVNSQRMAKDRPQFEAIGYRLMAIRRAFSDLGQSAWAERHGFTTTQYNNWEKGVRRIPVDEAERLRSVYGLSLDFIYRGRRDGLSETASNLL